MEDDEVPRYILIQDWPYKLVEKEGPFVHALDDYFDGWREVPMKIVTGVAAFVMVFVNIFGGVMCLSIFLAAAGDDKAVNEWLVGGMQLPAELVEEYYLPLHNTLQNGLKLAIGPQYVPIYQGVMVGSYSSIDFNLVKMWTSYWNWVQGVLTFYG